MAIRNSKSCVINTICATIFTCAKLTVFRTRFTHYIVGVPVKAGRTRSGNNAISWIFFVTLSTENTDRVVILIKVAYFTWSLTVFALTANYFSIAISGEKKWLSRLTLFTKFSITAFRAKCWTAIASCSAFIVESSWRGSTLWNANIVGHIMTWHAKFTDIKRFALVATLFAWLALAFIVVKEFSLYRALIPS